MYLTIQGIVLRVTDYNDKDALLTMLTRRHGRLTVKARGLRRKNSPLIAPCQLLSYGEFTLFEYRGQYTINEAQSIELFTPLRRDLTKLSLGTYFAQVSEVLSQEDMPNPDLQSLLLNCLYALSRLDLPESQVKAVFELCKKMSKKNYDNHNRWRNKTVAFRVSAEEDLQLETLVKLTGLTKQDYIIRRLLERDVVVQGNPRVYKALRDQLTAVLDELRRIEAGQGVNDELLDTIQMIATIMNGMQEDFAYDR